MACSPDLTGKSCSPDWWKGLADRPSRLDCCLDRGKVVRLAVHTFSPTSLHPDAVARRKRKFSPSAGDAYIRAGRPSARPWLGVPTARTTVDDGAPGVLICLRSAMRDEETGFIRVWTPDPKRAQRLWRRAGLEGSQDRYPLACTDAPEDVLGGPARLCGAASNRRQRTHRGYARKIAEAREALARG